ncbi:MAG: type II toxin-antitoxin system RelE/ParE family toxin [Pseudomonadota bacterium]
MIVRLTPRVVHELDDIADYSLAEWGEAHTRQYMAQLDARFEWLARSPGRGRNAGYVSPGLRRYRQGAHLIFYREIDGGIEIIGVPHASMDIDAYFDE